VFETLGHFTRETKKFALKEERWLRAREVLYDSVVYRMQNLIVLYIYLIVSSSAVVVKEA